MYTKLEALLNGLECYKMRMAMRMIVYQNENVFWQWDFPFSALYFPLTFVAAVTVNAIFIYRYGGFIYLHEKLQGLENL